MVARPVGYGSAGDRSGFWKAAQAIAALIEALLLGLRTRLGYVSALCLGCSAACFIILCVWAHTIWPLRHKSMGFTKPGLNIFVLVSTGP